MTGTWIPVSQYFSSLPDEVTRDFYNLNKEFLVYYRNESLKLFGPSPEFSLTQMNAAYMTHPEFKTLVLSSEEWQALKNQDNSPDVVALIAYRHHTALVNEWATTDSRSLHLSVKLLDMQNALNAMKFVNNSLCKPGTLLRFTDGEEYLLGGEIGTSEWDAEYIPHNGFVEQCKVLL